MILQVIRNTSTTPERRLGRRIASASVVAILVLACGLGSGSAGAEVILLQRDDGQHGVGWLFRDQAGACRIATARHVVEDTPGMLATPNAVDRHARLLATANPVAPQDPTVDLAFLQVRGILADEGCSLSRLSSVPLDQVLSTWTNGVLTIATPFDGQQTIRVERLATTRDAAGGETLAIAPLPGSDILQKGMSGGVIMAGERPIAMLIEVDNDSGTGIALRFDRVAAAFAAIEASGASSTPRQVRGEGMQDIAVLSGASKTGGSIGDFLDAGKPLVLAPERGRIVLLLRTAEPAPVVGIVIRASGDGLRLTKLIVEAAAGSDQFAVVRICEAANGTAELTCEFAPRTLDRIKLTLVAVDNADISLARIDFLTQTEN